jgi:hypothetical protein
MSLLVYFRRGIHWSGEGVVSRVWTGEPGVCPLTQDPTVPSEAQYHRVQPRHGRQPPLWDVTAMSPPSCRSRSQDAREHRCPRTGTDMRAHTQTHRHTYGHTLVQQVQKYRQQNSRPQTLRCRHTERHRCTHAEDTRRTHGGHTQSRTPFVETENTRCPSACLLHKLRLGLQGLKPPRGH